MKNISKFIAIGSAVAGCMLAGVKLVKSFKRSMKDTNASSDMEGESSASYEEELAEIRDKHAAEMEALEEMEKKNKAEHENRMSSIRKSHMEKMAEIEKIREELLNNVELRKNATPEESKELDERDLELLKKLYGLK